MDDEEILQTAEVCHVTLPIQLVLDITLHSSAVAVGSVAENVEDQAAVNANNIVRPNRNGCL